MTNIVDRLRYLSSPEAERMSDFQRINHFVEAGHEAADEIERMHGAAASPPNQELLECLPVEKLAKHFNVSIVQAQAAQDDIGFMYRELASAPQSFDSTTDDATPPSEPVAWRYRHKDWLGKVWRCTSAPVEFGDGWTVEPLYALSRPHSRSES